MDDDVALREAADDDAPELARLLRTSQRAAMPFLKDLHSTDDDVRFIEHVLERTEVWIAETPEQIAGFVAFTAATIEHLYVLDDFQGDGIGTALLAWAFRDGAARELWAFAQNARAIGFYESRGFTVVERTDGVRNEQGLPDVRMRREAES